MSENANTLDCTAPLCNHENPRPRPAKARLADDNEVTLHWQVADPFTEQAIIPPYSKADLDYIPYLPELERDQPRRVQAAQLIASQHEENHTFWFHPLCTECRGDAHATHLSITRWMALNPNRPVPLGDPALPEPRVEVADPAEEFLSPRQLAELASKQTAWLVDQIIPAGKHGIIRGRDASFKSFLALDFCLHIATAMDWQGRATSQGRVLYLAGEGVTSFDDRFNSWQETHGDLDEDEQEEVRVRNGTVDLHGAGPAFDRLLAFVKDWRPRILVADTLQRSAGAGDQNSASDMAVLRERMAQLQQAAGGDCTTIFVAHTTKGDGDTRGSSSIEDDSDFVLSCARSEMKLTLGVEKEKDAPDGYDIELAAKVVGKSLAIVDPKNTPGTVDDGLEGARAVRAVLSIAFGTDPLTKRALWQAVNSETTYGKQHSPSENTVGRYIVKAMEQGWVIEADKIGKSTRYAVHTDHLPEGHPRKTTTKEN